MAGPAGNRQGAIFAAAFAAVVLAVIAGTAVTTRNAQRTRVTITAWGTGEPTAQTKCALGERWIRGRLLRRMGLAASQDADGGSTPGAYCYVRLCATPGIRREQDRFDEDDIPAVGPQKLVAYDAVAAWPTLSIWCPGDNQDPSPCACSSGASCNRVLPDGGQVAAAKTGNTLGEGGWAGAGCVPKPCVELAGTPFTPAACK